jgi:hypothetical protein
LCDLAENGGAACLARIIAGAVVTAVDVKQTLAVYVQFANPDRILFEGFRTLDGDGKFIDGGSVHGGLLI